MPITKPRAHKRTGATGRAGPASPAKLGLWTVAGALLGSVRCWAGMALRRELTRPASYIDARLRFADGTESVVFRETRAPGAALTDPCVLIVRFRLRLLGRAALPHALFRTGCRINTPLFAGFRGFVSKLWLADRATGEYRGVYDWNGATAARDYAEPLCALLRVGSVRGSVDYHVIAGITRTEYLYHPDRIAAAAPAGGAWWRLREPMVPATGRTVRATIGQARWP